MKYYERMQSRPDADGSAAANGMMWQNAGWLAGRWKEALDGLAAGRGHDMERVDRMRVESVQMSLGGAEGFVDTYGDFLRTTVRFAMIGRSDWETMAKKILSRPSTAAKFLAYMIQEDIEEAFREEGLSLLPQKDDISAECGCGDKSGLCEHAMAILSEIGYILSWDPSAIFPMRGTTIPRLMKMEGYEPMPRQGSDTVQRDLSFFDPYLDRMPYEPAPNDFSGFWVPDTEPYELGPALVPNVNAVLPKQLGEIPLWGGSGDFFQTMEGIYGAASQAGMRAFLGEAGKGKSRRAVRVK